MPGTVRNGYTGIFKEARHQWDIAQYADIDWYNEQDYSNARTRLYAGQYTYADYFGVMKAYDENGNYLDTEYDDPGVVFYRANVLLNDYLMDTNGLDNTQRTKVAIHELGHTLNLRHNIGSVMDSNWDGYYMTPQDIDYDNVNWKY